MKVYVVESGIYSNRDIHGVYDSAERAIADCTRPGWKWTREVWVASGHTYESWTNGRDFADARHISAYELVTEGPLQSPDSEIVQ